MFVRIALALALVLGAASGAAAQEPDLIFKKSTVWRALTPDDKLAVYGIDDPLIEGVACHYTTPERGGISGTFGVRRSGRSSSDSSETANSTVARLTWA